MKILVFNWRDIKNPKAGGAEEYVHQIFSRLVRLGHEVTLFTSRFPFSLMEEDIDGIHIIRKGGVISLYLQSLLFGLKHANTFSLVVDSINTIPFFTPIFVRKPRISIVHHIGGMETYKLETGMTLSFLLTAMQKITLLLYKNEKIIVVSESTKRELLEYGIRESNVTVIQNGVSDPLGIVQKKFEDPTIIYLGRIKKPKRIDELLYVFRIVQDKVGRARLLIVGRGDSQYIEALKDLAKNLKLTNVTFINGVDSERKSYLLSRSWVYAITSIKEGWGISVIEANSNGLPVVAYRVPGLSDSVKNGVSGYLVKNGDRIACSRKIIAILLNNNLRNKLSISAKQWSLKFDWDTSAKEMNQFVKQFDLSMQIH